MEKSVVYEYSHKGLGRSVRKDSRSENESGNSATNKSGKGNQNNAKDKVKNDLMPPNPLANQNIKNVNIERKTKELSRPAARNDSNKSSASEKGSLPKTDFAVPSSRAPLPPSFEMEIDDDCLSTVTVASPVIRPPPPPPQINSTSAAKTSTKEKINATKGEVINSGTSVDASSSKADCKKDSKGGSSDETKTKVSSDTNSADKKISTDKPSVVLIRFTERLQKDEDWKKKVTESFKCFLQQRNKTVTKTSDAAGKAIKSEENKDGDRQKAISSKKEKKSESETSPSSVNKKEKSRNNEVTSSSSKKSSGKDEKLGHETKKSSSKEERHEGSKSRSHHHQDVSSKEEPKRKSASKSPRDSSGHRQRHNSGRSHSSRSSTSKEKRTSEPETRKRKAGSPEHSKPPKKEKVESRDKSHERSRKGSESRSRKSKKDLKEISRMQKSLFESENEEEMESSELRGNKSEKSKYHKKQSKSKESKSGKSSGGSSKKSPGEVDQHEIVVLSSDSSDMSPEIPRKSSKEKAIERRSSRKGDLNGRVKPTTVSGKDIKRELQVKGTNSKETAKKTSTAIESHKYSLSESSTKGSLENFKTSMSHSTQNVEKISKQDIDKNKTQSAHLEISSIPLETVTNKSDSAETENNPVDSSNISNAPPQTPSAKNEMIMSSEPVVSLIDICKTDNTEHQAISTTDDFPLEAGISDCDEIDLENLEATLNISSFTQEFACTSSAELDAMMNIDYDEDDKEIGKYAKLPGDSSVATNEISSTSYLSGSNNYGNGNRQGHCDQVENNQISLDDIDIQQDFPVLSIPDPVVPIVDHSEESEEEVPLIRIRTDLFTDSLETASSSCGISPTNAPEKQSIVPAPVIDNQTQQTNKIVEEVKRTIGDVLKIGTSVQQKLSAALEALKGHMEALNVKNFDSELQKKSEQSLNCFNTILQLGSQQLNEKVKRHSTILAVHNDNFAVTEMQMDKAANYFAIVVLINVMIADSLYNEFVTELMGVRYRILCILKVHFSQLAHALHGETWYFHVNSIIQGKLTSSQYEAWNLVANKSWAILKSFDETPVKITPIYENRVIGCDGFKEIVDNILMSVCRKIRQSPQALGNSEVLCLQDILNAIFVSNSLVPATQVATNVVTHESTMMTNNTASSYLNNCSLVYSPVSVSPISPPNCTNYGGVTSVTTTSAPMVFRETMANNMTLSSYTPSTINSGMNMQHQTPSNVRPASVHYREASNQNYTVTNSYDNCGASSFTSDNIGLPMTGSNNGNVSIISHSSQQAPPVQSGSNYYNTHSSQLYGMNSNEFNMYSQPQQVNRTSAPQVQMRSYPVMNHQNMSYNTNQVNLVRPNQHPVRMQQRQQSHVLSQSGNQYQGQSQSTGYLPTQCDRYQSNYNAIHALSTITGNQGMVQSAGNDSLSMQPQSCQLSCHTINSPQSTLPPLISTENHSHYQNDPDSACQATKSPMMHHQNLAVQGTPPSHHVISRSISMPVETADPSSIPLDRRLSFESFPGFSVQLSQQNSVSLPGNRVSNVGDSGLFLKVLRE